MPASSAIQQSLSLLVPSHAAKLPSQLSQLSESLLALSRQRASHLKPEEEIARAYACCEIACKRLRAQCRLPAVKAGGAPCKPAVYKKLVTFLERVLDQDVAATPTPRKQQQQQAKTNSTATATANANGRASSKRTAKEAELDSESESEAGPADSPSKRARNTNSNTNTPSKTPQSANAFSKAITGKRTTHKNDAGLEAPAFVMPSIRNLCRLFATPLVAPHVYTGTSIVLKLTGLWPRDETVGNSDEQDNDATETETRTGPASFPPGCSFDQTVTGLLIALYLMTLTRMQTAKMTTSVYQATCTKSVQELTYNPGTDGVEAWIRRINREGYCRGQDWWASVPESVFEFDPDHASDTPKRGLRRVRRGGVGGQPNINGAATEEYQDDDDEDHIMSATARKRRPNGRSGGRDVGQGYQTEGQDEEEEEDPDSVLLPGLATMMQHAVDFTSEERTQDFEAWKRTFLRKLDRLDRTKASAAAERRRTSTTRGRAGRAVAVQ
ncbi:hypothetical protein A1O1_02502 [Capronia coronata CBS 617.96]|uniref:ORC6 first cyclin-like domain-containing protein n=1 Tax=Capronia coronata CBS 617.96 TaxID=1182541 RepID=W9ZHY9_9EURO|nr:uncharacterized protein A1O1_02502 [Capronia coronata CBS 617.96]EXJ94109.1 hypothetical protein A1O1_02502 [Capronia coronata CBS 617.96]